MQRWFYFVRNKFQRELFGLVSSAITHTASHLALCYGMALEIQNKIQVLIFQDVIDGIGINMCGSRNAAHLITDHGSDCTQCLTLRLMLWYGVRDTEQKLGVDCSECNLRHMVQLWSSGHISF